MARKTKTVNYRKAELIGDNSEPVKETLQELIECALQSENVPSPVKLPYGIEGQNAYLLLFTKKNKVPYYRDGCLCGCVSLYDDESKVPLVDSVYDEKTGEVFNEEVEPMDSQNQKRKLEQQAHYFAIHKNHVAIMASSGKGIEMVEDFFTRLIQDETGILRTVSVSLVNIPTKNALALIADKTVRSVSFSSAAYTVHAQPMTEEEIAATKKSEKGTRKEYVRKTYEEKPVIRAIVNAIGLPAILDAYKNADDLEGISVAVEFKCTKRKDENSQKLVQDIARHVGGIEELSPVINLSGKSYVSKDMLTVKDTLTVDGTRYNAMKVLAQWLKEKIDTKQV